MLPKKLGRPKRPVVSRSFYIEDQKYGTAIFYLAVPKEEEKIKCELLDCGKGTIDQQKNLGHTLIFLKNPQGKGNGSMVNSGLTAAAPGTSTTLTTLNSGLAAGTSNSQKNPTPSKSLYYVEEPDPDDPQLWLSRSHILRHVDHAEFSGITKFKVVNLNKF